MLKIFFCFVLTLAGACATGEFVVLHSPDSVVFHGNEEIEQSLLKEVFAACLGFTVRQRGMWEGISITDPFMLPEALVSIAVEGVDVLDVPHGKKFRLDVDEIEETTWQAISGLLGERDNDNKLVRIYLGDGLDALGQSALGELKPAPIDESSLKALSLANEEDRKFLEEIQLLRAIAKKVPTAITADDKPDVYWLVVSGLRSVLDLHGNSSIAAKEALSLLNDAFNAINEAFMKAYDGKVVITAFTNDASQVRHTRSISAGRQRRDAQDQWNHAKSYSADYPVMFNIFLWFGVVFVFSLLAICIAIADMDPGRDSIIYRMTSNRMKKDN
ncbi:hypothetical protein KPH14_009970 [Odynerus spinipes]|uniref:Renin receptor n=1 Tax=Odynerus spinipes TaxID=1348599 RepID=A0AAD9RSR8_9HYME|nr:hypothetical protein KPH14_009970 [Odynerus spinipes]